MNTKTINILTNVELHHFNEVREQLLAKNIQLLLTQTPTVKGVREELNAKQNILILQKKTPKDDIYKELKKSKELGLTNIVITNPILISDPERYLYPFFIDELRELTQVIKNLMAASLKHLQIKTLPNRKKIMKESTLPQKNATFARFGVEIIIFEAKKPYTIEANDCSFKVSFNITQTPSLLSVGPSGIITPYEFSTAPLKYKGKQGIGYYFDGKIRCATFVKQPKVQANKHPTSEVEKVEA